MSISIDDALAELGREADHQRGAPFELWIARLNLAAERLSAGMSDDDRTTFIARASAAGLMDANTETGWLLAPTEHRCAHGLDPNCCPCGCSDIED
jgi:hypothetical protein